MSIINQLDKSVYNRISAGEVVESPFSVVKELIENSIDAKATEITINVLNGGKDLIEVIDNGCGILKDDLLKTVLPHATSKICNVEDLDNILTLGFRGEALASIASVSKMSITSRVNSYPIGFKFDVVGGECSELQDEPCKVGTKVKVCDLFFNTPARRKFLKTDRSEENAITDMVSRMILANPNVSFKYNVDGKNVISSFGDGIEDAILSIYGSETYNNCFKISNYKNGVKIEGYIGNHNFTKPNRTFQTVILNGRYIVNQTIQSAIHNAYASYLMKRRYPFYVLYITMPSEVVDVNVTPNKSDVRFMDNSVVYSALYSTISNVLDGSDKAVDIIVDDKKVNVVSDNSSDNNNVNANNKKLVDNSNDVDDDGYKIVTLTDTPNKNKRYTKDTFNSDLGQMLLNLAENPLVFNNTTQKVNEGEDDKPVSIDVFEENKRYIQQLEDEKLKKEQQFIIEEQTAELSYVGQVLNTYLIFQRNNDVFFVDQHAAHERLLYNKLHYVRLTGERNIQPLLVPYEINVNAIEYNYINSKLEYLRKLGIEISENKRGEFVISAIPCELIDLNIDQFFNEILQDDKLYSETVPDVINERLMQKACKSAIKAGKALDKSEVDSLMKLLNGNINLKCPHGRPIAVKISRKEIDKWFKRIV